MTIENYVGREPFIGQLVELLKGDPTRSTGVRVQSIEGPGGIGKTALFEHARARCELAPRKYLTMNIEGRETGSADAFGAVRALITSSRADPLPKAAMSYFPMTAELLSTMDELRREAAAEAAHLTEAGQEHPERVMALFDALVALGRPLNAAFPKSKDYVNAEAIGEHREDVKEALAGIKTLANETMPFLERLSIGNRTGRRNALRANALDALANALFSDLSALLNTYRGADILKPMSSKLASTDRLLLVIDDYEKVASSLGKFLVNHFIPLLKRAEFESTIVILGRDRLEATDDEWDRHLKPLMQKPIRLAPLSREELEQLVRAHGVSDQAVIDRAWSDTQGYPFYVLLWAEEMADGGKSALMLRRFHERTVRWMTPQQRVWLRYATQLKTINVNTFQQVLNSEEDGRKAFEWFELEGSVRDTEGATFRVREYLRSRLADYDRITDPKRFEAIARACAAAEAQQALTAVVEAD